MWKKNQILSGVKNQNKKHREKEVAVLAEHFPVNVSSVEKPNIDFMNLSRKWQEVV